MANIVITTHWLDGDVVPFINTGKLLKQRGHDVTIITHCHFEDRVKEAGLDFDATDSKEEFQRMVELMNRSNKGNQTIDEEEDLKNFAESNERRIREFHVIEKHIKKPNTVLLSKSRSSVAADLISEKYHIPLVSVFMNVIEPMSMVNFDEIYGQKELVRLNALREELKFEKVDSWLKWQACPKMCVGLWPEWYSGEEDDWPGKITKVGFPIGANPAKDHPLDLPDEVVKILEEKPILFTGSTARRIRDNYYKVVIEALGKQDRKVIVTCAYPELLPEKIPENVMCYSYINIKELLPYVSMIIHHGGAGNVGGALAQGVPQLILPGYIDQPFNGAICKKLGVAYTIPHVQWNVDNILDSVNRILEGQLDEKCQYYKTLMQKERGLEKVVELIEKVEGEERYAITYATDHADSTRKMGENTRKTMPKLSTMQKELLLRKMKEKKEISR